MRIDVSQSPALFRYASDKLGGHYAHEFGHRIITAIGDHGIVAQAVFTSIRHGCKCELTLWAEPEHGLAGRQFLRQVCKSAFIDMQCKRMHAITAWNNRRAQAVLQKMGFVVEAHLERWFPDDHGLMFKLMLPHCRWL